MRQFAALQEKRKLSIEQWTEAPREIFAPARWSGRDTGAFDAGMQQVIEGPRYATLCELDPKVAALLQLAMKRDKPAAARAVQHAWNTAFKPLTKSFSSAEAQAPTT